MHHVASYLALGATMLFIGIRLYRHYAKRPPRRIAHMPRTAYLFCFLCGGLALNGLVHLLHGASGDNFAAPFGFAVHSAFLKHTLNVVWGMLNLSIAYMLGRRTLEGRPKYGVGAFILGVATMALILCFVFS
jgi:hypothetical protein